MQTIEIQDSICKRHAQRVDGRDDRPDPQQIPRLINQSFIDLSTMGSDLIVASASPSSPPPQAFLGRLVELPIFLTSQARHNGL